MLIRYEMPTRTLAQGFFVLAFILNITFLYFPPFGLPKSSIGAWIKDWPNRHWALLAGIICGLGNTFQFMGAASSPVACLFVSRLRCHGYTGLDLLIFLTA